MESISITYSLDNVAIAAKQLLEAVPDKLIFLFYGEMGAGKTTLIKSLCTQLGVSGQVSSPTFAIVNEYAGKQGKVFHFDFYRLKNETEALDMGYEEYFYSGNYCFVEWPEKIANLLPPSYAEIHLEVVNGNTRYVTLNKT